MDEGHCGLIWAELARVAGRALVIVISHEQTALEDGRQTVQLSLRPILN